MPVSVAWAALCGPRRWAPWAWPQLAFKGSQVTGEPMHAAGYRVPQILGGDRLLVLGAMACCVMFALLVFALWALGAAAVVWAHVWTRRFYPARSGLYSTAPHFPASWRR